MRKLGKCIVSIFLSALMVWTSLTVLPIDVSSEADATVRDIEITLAADAVSNNLNLSGFSDKLKNELYTKYGVLPDKVHITTVDSSSSSTDSITWNKFDHTNNASLATNTSSSIVSYFGYDYSNLMRDYHIVLSGSTINFYGYGSPAYKDFLYCPNSNANNKIFTFTMDEAVVDYHTGEGAGFIFNAKYTYNSASDRRLSCYMVLLGQSYIYLFRLDNIEVSQFINEQSYGLSGISWNPGYAGSAWGGTVTNLVRVNKPSTSYLTKRYLKLVASPETVSFYQFTDSTYTTVKDKMLEGTSLPASYNSFGFGPICSYLSHGCSSLTNIRFSDVKLTEDTSVAFAETVRSTNWQYGDSMKVFVNVDNDGVSDFGSTAKLSSILYYTMLNNAHYIGWGVNNAINIGGYATVKAQSDGFVTRNNGLGAFVNRSDSTSTTLDQGVAAIAKYIADQLDLVPEIEKPVLNTTINNLSVTCSAPDLLTSNGNPIGAYGWKCLDIASGTWSDNAVNSNSSSFTFPQNTYKMIGLRIQDSVTGQWSDYSYAYIATVANVDPVSQFSLDKTTLMPDSSIAALNTGTVVTATDTSYMPNGSQIAGWEWTVLDQTLAAIPGLAKSYTSNTKPASITFDFAGKAAGTYTIKLRTRNSASVWSNYYTQKVVIYSESASGITISTTNDTTNVNPYTGTQNIPFTISSTGGNITSYRVIRLLPDSTMEIGDWTKVNTASVSSTTSITDTPCTVYIQAIDAAGSSKTQSVGTYRMPISVSAVYEGGNTVYVDSTKTNKTVVLKTTNEYLQYSIDSGTTWNTFVSPMSVTTSQTFKFRYIGDTDTANYATFSTDIRKTLVSNLAGFDNNGVYKVDITPTFSGVNAVLSRNGGASSVFSSGTTLTQDGRYTLAMSDAYGNMEIAGFMIDKTAPIILASGNPASWKNQNQTISFMATDPMSGVASVSVTGSLSGNVAITGADGAYSFTAVQNETYTIEVTDGAGNIASTDISVEKIDKANPVIGTVLGNPTSWTNQNPTLSFQVLESLSGIASVTVTGSVSGNMTLTNSAGTYSFTADKNETFSISVTDQAGNTAATTVTVDKLDKTSPFIGDPNGNPTSWTNQDQTISFVTTSVQSGILSVVVTGSLTGSRSVSFQSGTYRFTAVCNETYTITVTDEAGNSTQTSLTVSKIDKTVPGGTLSVGTNAWNEFLNAISFGLFFRNTVEIKMEGSDAGSGIQKIDYIRSETPLQVAGLQAAASWTTYGGTFNITPIDGRKFIFYARVMDNAGNIAYLSTDGSTFDTAAPVISGVVAGSTYYVNQNVTVTDPHLDTITVNGDPFVNGSALEADKTATYVIVATDKAGNSTSVTVYTKPIASLAETVAALTESTAKSSDAAALTGVSAVIDTVMDTVENGATAAQIEKLEDLQSWIGLLLTRIQSVQSDISEINADLAGLSVSNAKSSNSDNLQNSLDAVNNLLQNFAGNLTENEKTALQQMKANIESMQERIADVAEAYEEASDKMTGMTLENVKSSDKTNLESALTILTDLLTNRADNLTVAEKTAVEILKAKAEDLLEKIAEIGGILDDIYDKTSAITTDNAKSSDEAILEQALEDLNDLLTNHSGNLTAAEISGLQARRTDIEAELARIQDVREILADVNTKSAGKTVDNVKSSNKADLESALSAVTDLLDNYDGNLTSAEKSAAEDQKAAIELLLARQKQVADAIADVAAKTGGITVSSAKSSDKTNLESALATIEDLLTNRTDNLTVGEKSALEQKKADIEADLARIRTVAETISEIYDTTDTITLDNAKSSDKALLDTELEKTCDLLDHLSGNLTEAEKTGLTDKKADIEAFLARIQMVADILADVNGKTSGKTSENVKSSDKEELFDALDSITNLLEDHDGNLTADEKEAAEDKKTSIEQLIAVIDQTTGAIADINKATEGMTESNVKSTDKTGLESALETVRDLLDNRSDNLTGTEKTALEQKKTDIGKFLEKIQAISDVIADVNGKTAGKTVDNVKSSDKSDLQDALAKTTDLLDKNGENLTQEEKKAAEDKKASLEEFLTRISLIADAIANVNARTYGITTANVQSGDKANLESALETLRNLLNNYDGNLTAGEKTLLEQKKALAEGALAKIQEAADAVAAVDLTIKDINAGNVTKNERTALENARADYAKILSDYDKNLTDSEKQRIQTSISAVKAILTVLDEVDAVETKIMALPSADAVTKSDAAAIDDASRSYEALNEYQKKLVDPEKKTKLNNVVIALKELLLKDDATGTMVEGVDGTTFDINTELSVTPIIDNLDEQTASLYNFAIQGAAEGQELVSLFDIKLLLNGVAIQPNGKVKITLQLTDEMKRYTNLQVVFIADDGTVTILPFERSDSAVWFYTDHFSNYGIIGTPPSVLTPVASLLIALGVLLAGAAGFLVFLFLKRRKKDKEADSSDGLNAV